VVTGLALALFALVYRTAPRTETATGSSWAIPVLALSLAAAVWGFYNAALAMVFSFGPLILNARGLEPAAAGWMVSLFIIGVGVGAPLGGLLADKTGRRDQVIGGCLLGYLVLVPLVPVLPDKALPGLFAATGLILGSGAGQIMTLPSAVLSPASRAFGMGVFFAIYYLTMLVAPTVAGALADWTGNAIWALWLGVGMIGLTGLALAVFRRVARGVPA
jgi:MFS family permease